MVNTNTYTEAVVQVLRYLPTGQYGPSFACQIVTPAEYAGVEYLSKPERLPAGAQPGQQVPTTIPNIAEKAAKHWQKNPRPGAAPPQVAPAPAPAVPPTITQGAYTLPNPAAHAPPQPAPQATPADEETDEEFLARVLAFLVPRGFTADQVRLEIQNMAQSVEIPIKKAAVGYLKQKNFDVDQLPARPKKLTPQELMEEHLAQIAAGVETTNRILRDLMAAILDLVVPQAQRDPTPPIDPPE